MKDTAIAHGITYLTAEGFYEDFHQEYTEEMTDAKTDMNHIKEDMTSVFSHYESKVIELVSAGGYQLEADRLAKFKEAFDNYSQATNDLNGVIDAYLGVADMIDHMEELGANPNYIHHRKGEMVRKNANFNTIFDRLDQFVNQLYAALTDEIAYVEHLIGGGEQVERVDVEHSLLTASVETNRLLIEVLQYIVPIADGLRDDMMKLKVNSIEDEIANRKAARQAELNAKMVEDVRDYDDLEGQYRHTYDEEGNLLETIEGGEGGNRRGLQVIIGIIIVVIIIFAAYVYMK